MRILGLTNSAKSFLLAICWACSAGAFAYSGNDFHAALQAKNSLFVQVYLEGVLDGYLAGSVEVGLLASGEAIKEGRTLNGLQLVERNRHCMRFPSGKYNPSQLVDVLAKYLIEHPESRHESANILILDAVSKVFPCK